MSKSVKIRFRPLFTAAFFHLRSRRSDIRSEQNVTGGLHSQFTEEHVQGQENHYGEIHIDGRSPNVPRTP